MKILASFSMTGELGLAGIKYEGYNHRIPVGGLDGATLAFQ
ncbi:MAG: hypothetical protein RIE86_12940 [Imperialibacter sp.]